MRKPAPTPHAGHDLAFERLLFFSDAVFAIAITLLVLNLKPAFDGRGAFTLAPIIPNLLGFGLSFYVVGRYWLAHHHLFETVKAYDRRLLTVNLFFLASIAFLPFPTSVVAEAKPGAAASVFYALAMAAVGLLMILLTLAARRPTLMRAGESRGDTAALVAGMAAGPVVFLASAGVALFDPRAALWLLLALIPASAVTRRLGAVLRRRLDAAPAPARPRRKTAR